MKITVTFCLAQFTKKFCNFDSSKATGILNIFIKKEFSTLLDNLFVIIKIARVVEHPIFRNSM